MDQIHKTEKGSFKFKQIRLYSDEIWVLTFLNFFFGNSRLTPVQPPELKALT